MPDRKLRREITFLVSHFQMMMIWILGEPDNMLPEFLVLAA